MAISILALAACVSSGPESKLGKQKPERIRMSRTSDCVFNSSIDGFQVLDRTHVVLFGMGRRKAYLAEIAGVCFDLNSEFSIATVDGDNNGQICGFGRDSIAYRQLGRVENCRILGLEELSEERRIELLGSSPNKTKREKQEDKEAKEDKEKD
ncbi:MAG: DUF6491 family protein [Steroidobacteraceae bacterium]